MRRKISRLEVVDFVETYVAIRLTCICLHYQKRFIVAFKNLSELHNAIIELLVLPNFTVAF